MSPWMAAAWCICSLFSPCWKCFFIVDIEWICQVKEMVPIGPGTRSVYVMCALANWFRWQ